MTTAEQLRSCAKFVGDRIADLNFKPKAALVLGSGLGDFANTEIEAAASVEYKSIPHFPVSTVEGHDGRFVFGYCRGVPVACMQGRVHMYEGYTPQEAVLPLRVLYLLGAEILFLTNAAGGMQPGMQAGDLMLITDQISSFVPSPLRGANVEGLGVRFPDMSEIYSRRLRGIIKKAAAAAGVGLREGVYLQTAGPQYESPAEIRMFRSLGADAVGMSTAIEAIAARHCGMEVCGISCISNLAAGISPTPLSHEEVKAAADAAAPRFKALVAQAIADMG